MYSNSVFGIMRCIILTVLFQLFLTDKPAAQNNETITENNFLNSIIEDFLSNNDEINVDPTILYDQLNDLKKNPIDINKSDLSEWQQLFFIPDNQLNDILAYKAEQGQFLSVYELQAVPSLGIDDVKKMLPFIKISGSAASYNVPFLTMLKSGKNELYLRSERILEEQLGFSDSRKNSGSSYYLGDPNKLFVRYRHQYSNKLTYGFTAEKDPGEEFFTGSNKKGFDYYTFHVFLKDYNPKIKAVAIGDYAVSFGQGLILHSGFGYGKSSFATLIKRSGPVLRPYTSTLENNFFRGAAGTVGVAKNIDVTAFVSKRKTDANLIVPDSTVEYDFGFSSLQQSGFHRTSSEIADRNAIDQTIGGVNLKYTNRNFALALNGLYTSFNKEFTPQNRLDNIFDFRGSSLLNTSIDYSYIYRNFYFFGEFAKSDNSSIASVNGVLISLDRRVDLALLHRRLPVDYHSLNPAVFAEGSNGANENGFYIGTKIYPSKGWTLDAYIDIWKNPWLKFNVASPSTGKEFLGKIQYSIKRKLDIYLQYRNETKAQNVSADENLQMVGEQNRQQLRIHFAHKLSKRLELRNRAEWSLFKSAGNVKSRGFMIYQDIIYKPIEFPVSFTTRFAYFDTQDYNSRIYAFENDLLYSFSIPPYYFTGTRWYLNLRSRLTRNLMLEAGISQTVLANQSTIGSGLDEISGNSKTEVKAQLKVSF